MEIRRLTRDETAETCRETKFSGANGDREILFFPVYLTTRRIGNLTQLTFTFPICDHMYVCHTTFGGGGGQLDRRRARGGLNPLCARIKGANREVSEGKADV